MTKIFQILMAFNYMKYLNLLFFYLLVLIGLIITSWTIWTRFIRERTVRDIPDFSLTEYRFWILVQLCCIYLLIVKYLIKPTQPNNFLVSIIEYLYLLLKRLDHAIKYNSYTKAYYFKFIKWLLKLLLSNHITKKMICFQIIPRMILVIFLLIDTFYVNRVEMFYNVILIGILPFLFRYFKYSLNDIKEEYLKELESKYDYVWIFEEGYEFDISRTKETEAELHYTKVSLREYIEIKFESDMACYGKEIEYRYIGHSQPKEERYKQYRMQKYHNSATKLTSEDFESLREEFKEIMPQILKLDFYLKTYSLYENEKIIKWPKIIIFSLYFICWSFILGISYYYTPVELIMFKSVIEIISKMVNKYEDPFG